MRQNKTTMLGITFVVIAVMAVILFAGHKLNTRLQAADETISTLQEQTDAEHKRTEEISERQKYLQRDEYEEQIAKEKLGLVKDGEIIFKDKNAE